MDILNTLEDLDSRLEKARGNVAKWFGLLAAFAIIGVVLTYVGKSFLASKTARSWSVFDNNLIVGGGLSRGPAVFIKSDPELAGPEIRKACGGSWGDLAELVQSTYADEVDKTAAIASRIAGIPDPDPAIREVMALASAEPVEGAKSLGDRVERLKAWAEARPGLHSNQTKGEGPETVLEIEGGRFVFKWDPKIPADVSAEARGLVSEGLLEGSKLVWNPVDRAFDLVLSGDPARAERLSSVLEKVTPDDASFSLFKGTVVAKPTQQAPGAPSSKKTLGLLAGDHVGREFDLIPIGALTEGSALLPSTAAAEPEKTELPILGVK